MILNGLDEQPWSVLVPPGAPRKFQRGMSKAAKTLAGRGKIRTFKMFAMSDATGCRLKTCVARVDDAEADAYIAEHAVELEDISGKRAYEGSKRHRQLETEAAVQTALEVAQSLGLDVGIKET